MTENSKHLYLIYAFNDAFFWFEIWHGYDLKEAIAIFNELAKHAGADLELRSVTIDQPYHEWRATKPKFDSLIEICKFRLPSTETN